MSKVKKKFMARGADVSARTAVAGPKPPDKRLPFTTVTTLKAAIIIAILGVVVFFSGLSGQFLGDDSTQIVNNIPVHSVTNIGTYFNGSTFYDGQAKLGGVYYRPLMTTTFSVLYALFGANPFSFHLVQLLLHILCAFVLFLVLRYFLWSSTSLALALVFLLHPITSQAVFSIACTQS